VSAERLEANEELESGSLLPVVPFGANEQSTRSPTVHIAEVDVVYGSRTSLVYDPVSERYIPTSHPDNNNDNDHTSHDSKSKSDNKLIQGWRTRILPGLRHSFLPEGVYPSYYRFIRWRILQRFVNANVHVFGTQSLLMGLGLKTHSLGLSAALNWVLKDALGKIARMAWASKMGQKFDSDAKRWRFRSSLVFAFGNALEITTYMFPSLFLVWATLANCCKQTSMLTSSSTRTAIYNSFRDGTRENIGDITAKGEAQIAVVDLLGIASGVTLSKMVGMSVKSVFRIYIILQLVELFCLYHEIRAVEFRVLNFERLAQLVTTFIHMNNETQQEQQSLVVLLPTPQEMARTEKIFLPPQHLSRRAIAFGSLGRAKLAPDELEQLLRIFRNEKFLLVVGTNVKNRRQQQRRRRRGRGLFWLVSHQQRRPHPEDQCHIVLHTDATNVDIVKSTLALSLLRQALVVQQNSTEEQKHEMRSLDYMTVIQSCYQNANRLFPFLLKSMAVAGWAPPARFMFGRVTMRADWPLGVSTNEK
jgi:hypothetical protein